MLGLKGTFACLLESFNEIVMSIKSKLIGVRLVMPHCMFSMQLLLSSVSSFVFIKSKGSYVQNLMYCP